MNGAERVFGVHDPDPVPAEIIFEQLTAGCRACAKVIATAPTNSAEAIAASKTKDAITDLAGALGRKP